MNNPIPIYFIKKIIFIREERYEYSIDEDGYGTALIEDQIFNFFVNEYGEVVPESIRLL